MNVFTTKCGNSIDLDTVFAISQLLFDWRSEYGIHSYESDWYVLLGIKGTVQELKFSLGCGPIVRGADNYECVQKKRCKSANEAGREHRRLKDEWTKEPK